MALVVADRVQETTSTTGTSDYVLIGAADGYQSFGAVMANADTTYYAITNDTDWEVGIGTYSTTGPTLARTTILASSNGGSAVSWGVGVKNIFISYAASKSVYLDANGDLLVSDKIVHAGDTNTAIRFPAADTVSVETGGTERFKVENSTITTTVPIVLPADPTLPLQAATKEYVDTIASAGIHYHAPVRVESPINLNATYNNGTSGVGATLTNAGTQAALVIDGVTVATNDRVLVYQQTNQTQNGVYVVTNTGSGSTNWVLTRSDDTDSYGPSDPDALGAGDAFFVQQGATGAGELYVCNTDGTITFGTTNITFTQIAATAVYTAGSGLTLTGTVFANAAPDQTVTLTQGGATTISGTYPNFTITSTDTTYSAGNGIGLAGTTFSVAAGSGLTQDASGLSHADTSSQSSVDNSGATFVQDVNLDTFGHVTGLTSVTVTPSLIGAPSTTGVGASGSWGISVTGTATNVTGTVAIANGGTGATTAGQALNNLGLTATATELNYTSGVTSAIQTQLNAKAPLASPALTGTPTAPTAAVGTNTTQVATTAFVNAEIANDAPTKTGGGASGTWDINVTGNAATATSATTATSAINPTFSGDSTNKADITTRTDSGFYETDTGTTAEGWPRNDGAWQHMIAATHSNDSNYYSMQLAGGFFTQQWYMRNTNGTGTTGWSELLTSASYNSYAPSLTGTGASGTWGISISGNAATASNSSLLNGISSSQLFNNMGNNHSTYTDFNSVPNFGTYYLQQGTNGPTGVTANQFYGFTMGLGNDYALSLYGTQMYWPREAQNADTYIYVRDRESGTWGSWRKTRAGNADTVTNGVYTTSNVLIPKGTISGDAGADATTGVGLYQVDMSGYSDLLVQLGGVGGSTPSIQLRANYGDSFWIRASRDSETQWDGVGSRSYQLLHSGNYNSFAPTLTGTGASGTWGINVTGNSGTTSQRNFSGDIAATGQGRFTGWYGGGSGNNALAAEIGISGGTAYLLSYNRGTSTYGSLTLNATNISLDPQGGSISLGANIGVPGDNHITFGPNSTWGSSLRVGGNGRTATGTEMASVVTTDGNLHLDAAASSSGIYLNYYAGTTGVAFGNGSSDVVAWMGPDGDLWKGNSDNAGTQYVQNSGTWGIGVTGSSYSVNLGGTGNTISSSAWAGGGGYHGYTYNGGNFRFGFSSTSGVVDVYADGNFYATDSSHLVLHAGNYNSYSPTLTGGNASGTWGINVTGSSGSTTGNAATATNLSTNRTNWSSNGTISAVVGQLAWKNYGNNHTIFDASNSTSPSGTGVNDTNAQIAWSASYPTLMGWNGANTYGVRVDSARVADSATTATTASNTTSISSAVGSGYTWTGVQQFQSNQNTSGSNPPLQAYSTGGNGAIMSFHRGAFYAINMGLDSDNVFRIGGWSAPANLLQMDMSGNLTLAGSVSATSFSSAGVGAGTAGLAAGAVGSYAFLYEPGSTSVGRSPGYTVAGSSLTYSAVGTNAPNGVSGNLCLSDTGGSPSGTWRLMGAMFAVSGYEHSSVWLRIS